MRFFGLAAVLALISTGGCGYLPSEMAPVAPMKKQEKPTPHARVTTRQHTVSCTTPAKGFQLVRFEDLYATTDSPRHPFREVDDIPAQFDVHAYVWGFDDCMHSGRCKQGDHYWLIGRGPGDDLTTWVVTPQFPRLTIQSTCRNHLKVGKRYRFSFSRGKLVGFGQ